MKKHFVTLFFCIAGKLLFAQTHTFYTGLTTRADSLYNSKSYQQSGSIYAQAFKWYPARINTDDLYNAACAWALAGKPDSAFWCLNTAAAKNFHDLKGVSRDKDLTTLHGDTRWLPLIDKVSKNKDIAEAGYNPAFVKMLDSVYKDDQADRLKINEFEQKYGEGTKQMDSLWNHMGIKDSLNLIKVENLVDKYGWLGPETIGDGGSFTLFIVIQHANHNVEAKYLPLLRKAVNEGRARGMDLAYLEDRVAIDDGKKQIYGSQLKRDTTTGKWYFFPIEDEVNVDKRRDEAGLGPISAYAHMNNFEYRGPGK